MRGLKRIILGFFFALLCFIDFSLIWISKTWKNISYDEIVFHLSHSSQGVGRGLVVNGIVSILIPVLVLVLIWTALTFLYSKNKYFLIAVVALPVISFISFVAIFLKVNKQYGIIDYYKHMNSYSTFISDNYVNPDDVSIQFPENKRNVIYIYLESMEITYANEMYGGAFSDGCIDELCELALSSESVCFNGNDGLLNGAYCLRGCDWTMGGIFAESAALPLITYTDNAEYSNLDSFYPYLETFGDILNNEGYNQTFLCGSDAAFGGRREYLSDHGDYTVFDLNYARSNGYVPNGYSVFWGIEDAKLFDFAKTELEELDDQSAPFNLTLLTVDTHFEDGYLCEDCPDDYGDQYSNVMACSSRRVLDFIEWCKEQDFYENTTIVICGDHITMDSDFCNDVDADYNRRVYTCIINSAAEVQNDVRRDYSTLDMMPTTLAAMGCEFSGDRLGLGANLFSDTPTLVETFGTDYLNEEFSYNTVFFNQFGVQDTFSYSSLVGTGKVDFYSTSVFKDDMLAGYEVSITGLENSNRIIERIDGCVLDSDGNILCEGSFQLNNDKSYTLYCDFDNDVYREENIQLRVNIYDNTGVEHSFYDSVFPRPNVENTNIYSIEELRNIIKTYNDAYIFISLKDEALGSLSDSDVNVLNSMGFNVSNNETYRYSYAAVYDSYSREVIDEDLGPELIELSGQLGDDIEYSVISAGFYGGDYSNIYLWDEDFSVNRRGINIAVFSKNGIPLLMVNYDVYAEYNPDERPVENNIVYYYSMSSDESTATLIIPHDFDSWRAYIYVWDPEHLSVINYYELEDFIQGDNRFWICNSIDMTELNYEDTYFSVYFYDSELGVIYKGTFKIT